MIKTVPVLLHCEETPPGAVLTELTRLGFTPEVFSMHNGAALPLIESFDHIVICGGSPNVDQTDRYPFLKTELAFIEKTLAAQKSITAICLGAQLCAQVLGAKVYAHPRGWEVGWHDVEVLGASQLAAPALPAFHYHRYVFEKPQGAETLARNAWWDCQAFTWKNQITAFQFHPESSAAWVRECALDPELPAPSAQVQTGAEILEQLSLKQPVLANWFAGAMAHSTHSVSS